MKISEIENKKTLYAHRSLIGPDDFFTWLDSQEFKSEIPRDKFHVTIAYSKNKVDWNLIPAKHDTLLVKPDPDRKIERFGDEIVVLLLKSDDLHKRWEEFKQNGASYDFDEYRPHISLTYKGKSANITEPYTGPLYFGPEEFDIVKEDWNPNE